jgi:hypothetical protein
VVPHDGRHAEKDIVLHPRVPADVGARPEGGEDPDPGVMADERTAADNSVRPDGRARADHHARGDQRTSLDGRGRGDVRAGVDQRARVPPAGLEPSDDLPAAAVAGTHHHRVRVRLLGVLERAHGQLVDRGPDPPRIARLEQADDLEAGVPREVHHLAGEGAAAGHVDALAGQGAW